MKKHPMLKYLKEQGPQGDRLPLIMCPGCGSGQVLNFIFMAVDALISEQGYQKDHFVFISGVGCHARLTSHYLNFDSGWTIHGRTLAIATGALLANPDLQPIVITGDGDSGAIGGNHFIHIGLGRFGGGFGGSVGVGPQQLPDINSIIINFDH